jgi:cell division protein ZipA
MKDWVIIGTALLILAILIDGIRRKRNERYGRIKVSRNLNKRSNFPPEEEEEEVPVAPSFSSELPNGGARVIRPRDEGSARPSIEKKSSAKSFLEKQNRQELLHTEVSRRAQRPTEQADLHLNESVPILMESVAHAKSRHTETDTEDDAGAARIEPSFSALSPSDLDAPDEAELAPLNSDDDYEEAADPLDTNDNYRAGDQDHEDSAFADEDENSAFDNEYNDDPLEQDDYEDDELAADEDHESAQEPARLNTAEPEEVLIINVMAFKGEMFNGSDLLDIILKCGMRYGDMDIFHRYTDAKGDGAHLFSMANMVKPGTFDLDAMDEFETPGISLFMTLPLKAESMQSFDLMLDTARAIAETLDGELKDEQRSVMTRQTVEHCRQRIRDFERLRLFRRPR